MRPAPLTRDAGRAAQFSWCLYDWANSAFPTVIVTFVFAAYFTQSIAPDAITGTAQWGIALSLSGIAIAIVSPIVGAIADKDGRRKPWLAGCTALCAVCAAALWLARPDAAFTVLALALFALANFAFEVGVVFYNAMLPTIAAPRRLGRLSGWGWGLGYAGGLACLLVAFAFVQPETAPFGLDKQAAEHVRIVGPLVALWFVLFAIPLFRFTPDGVASGLSVAASVRGGLAEFRDTLRRLHRLGPVGRFLLARLLYIDGLNTLFAFGGIYAAGTFGMGFGEIIQFGIALNVTAGLGAAAFGWIDDHIGPKRTVLISLCAIVALGVPLLLIESKTGFWALALGLGVFMGPAQAASRSLMARLAPPDQLGAMFGLFAFSGKITAFLGPAVLATVTTAFGSQRAGMATVIAFIAAGGLILVGVREEK
ncbi:MAG: MFS transporter [Alphaproteobacteria bacterium]